MLLRSFVWISLLCLGLPCGARALAHAGHLSVSGITTPHPRLAWTLQSSGPAERGVRQTAFEIHVASSMHGLEHPDLWLSGHVSSSAMNAVYSGKPLPPASILYWQLRTWQVSISHRQPQASAWSEAAGFTTPLEQWTAPWIAAPDERDGQPLPLLRRSFTVSRKPAQALLFVSGLGQYEARLNGENVTKNVLTPGWTNYRKHILYDTYDVTAMVHPGANALGVLLGNGMYNVAPDPGRYTKFTGSFGQPKLRLELHLRYADKREDVVESDTAWRTVAGPITFSHAYGGEDFDARREPDGWDKASFDDSHWSSAVTADGPGGAMEPEQTPAVEVIAKFVPIAVTHPREGVIVYDLGQNAAGWPVLTALGPAGATVRMLPGELLDAKGEVTQRSAAASPEEPALFQYTLKGRGAAESWHPRFSYYGFRYVQVEATAPGVKLLSLTSDSISAGVRTTGEFHSSNDLWNRIHTIILNAERSNMVSVLTDCPHREKLGWLEQTQLFAGSLMSNYDVASFYGKMAEDMGDAQLASGLVPSIAPEYVAFVDDKGRSNDFRDSPEWGSAVVLSAWAAYTSYGDPTPLRAHYAEMARYVDYLGSRAKDGIIEYGLGDWYDIGPKEPGYSQLTGKKVTATGTYYQDLAAMASIASILNKSQDSETYAKRATAVRDAFNAALFNPATGQYDRGSQTANAVPLALGIVPANYRAAVLQNLVADIEMHGYHVTAGDVGFHYVVRALTDTGRSDVLSRMMSLTTSPSYGYQVKHGATTLTEAWDTNPLSSQNHFMLGHGEEWFYRGLAGIDVDMSRRPEEQIRIHPYIIDQGTGSAAASLDTALGTVKSAWTKTTDSVTLDVTIPPNATGVLTMPAEMTGNATKSARTLEAAGVHKTDAPGTFLLDSGIYHFRLRAGSPAH